MGHNTECEITHLVIIKYVLNHDQTKIKKPDLYPYLCEHDRVCNKVSAV